MWEANGIRHHKASVDTSHIQSCWSGWLWTWQVEACSMRAFFHLPTSVHRLPVLEGALGRLGPNGFQQCQRHDSREVHNVLAATICYHLLAPSIVGSTERRKKHVPRFPHIPTLCERSKGRLVCKTNGSNCWVRHTASHRCPKKIELQML